MSDAADTDVDAKGAGVTRKPDEAALAAMSQQELLTLGGKLDGVEIAFKEPRWPVEGTKAEKRAEGVLADVVERVDPAFEKVQEGVTVARKTVTGRSATESVTPRGAAKATATRAAKKAPAKKAPAKKAAAATAPAKKAPAKKAPAKKAAESG